MDNNFDDEAEYIDVGGTILALHTAWKLMPTVSLSELLDTVTTVPFVELTNEELINELNHFIHQNS